MPFAPYLSQAVFIDYNAETVDILNQRINDASLSDKAKSFCIDFLDQRELKGVLSRLKRGLNLVLVDPTECNVPFDTIATLSKELENVDFIVNVPAGTDLRRNIQSAVLDPKYERVKKKYSQFIGDDSFFDSDMMMALANSDPSLDKLIECFMGKYRESWEKLGYKHFDVKSVRHYYKLMFASKHSKGLEFWHKANKYDPHGQRMLWEE